MSNGLKAKPYTLCGQCYDKDEVDRYIAEIMENHKKTIRQMDADWTLLCMSREKNAVKYTGELFKDRIRHQKYKRCMAMAYAEWAKQMVLCDHPESILYRKAFRRERKWEELAKKFKETTTKHEA